MWYFCWIVICVIVLGAVSTYYYMFLDLKTVAFDFSFEFAFLFQSNLCDSSQLESQKNQSQLNPNSMPHQSDIPLLSSQRNSSPYAYLPAHPTKVINFRHLGRALLNAIF